MAGTNSFLDFLNSPGGAAAINAAGGAASAYGQAKSTEAQQQQTADQFAASATEHQSNQDRANANAALTPLGESQNFTAKNALLNSILPNMRNMNSGVGVRPGGGSFLPDGGLDKGMINSLYGSTPTLESLAQHGKQLAAINPTAPQENLANYGQWTPQQAQPFQQNVADYQGGVKGTQDSQRAQITKYVQDQMAKEKASGSTDGFWHKFAKIAGIAGGVAATVFTGGAASPLLMAAIGAGSGALSSWGNGGNPLVGAAMGAGSSALGSAINGKVPGTPDGGIS